MLHQLSIKISEHIVSHASVLEDDQMDTIRYAIETLLGELSKLAILWLVFFLLHMGHLFTMTFIIFSCIRVVAGGFHFSTYLSCLLGSFIMYAVILTSNHFIILSSYSTLLLIMPSLIILYLFTPIIPTNRYDKVQSSIPNKRFMTALTILFLFVFAHYTNQVQLFTMSLFVFAIQLLIGGLKYEKLL